MEHSNVSLTTKKDEYNNQYIVSIDIGGTNIKVGYKKQSQQKFTLRIIENSQTFFSSVEDAQKRFSNIFDQLKIHNVQCLGISCCGIANSSKKKLIVSIILSYFNKHKNTHDYVHEYAICDQFQKKFRLQNDKIVLLNDAIAAVSGAIQKFKMTNIIVLIIGTSLGIGVGYQKSQQDQLQVYGCESWSNIRGMYNGKSYKVTGLFGKQAREKGLDNEEIQKRLDLLLELISSKYQATFGVSPQKFIMMGGNSIKLFHELDSEQNFKKGKWNNKVIHFQNYEQYIQVHLLGSIYYIQHPNQISAHFI